MGGCGLSQTMSNQPAHNLATKRRSFTVPFPSKKWNGKRASSCNVDDVDIAASGHPIRPVPVTSEGYFLDQTQAIADFFRIVRRRIVLLLVVSVLGIAGTIGYAFMQPPVYETSAKILIESQQIPSDLARSTVNMSAAERLQLIEQRLTSRNYLISVIEDFDLFSDAPDLTLNDKITRLRDAIKIESILVSGQNQSRGGDVEIFAFTIAMRHENAEQAAEIVNTFVETAVAENLRVRAERARDTRAYFEQQVERVADLVIEVENQISVFKRENESALPESLEYRRDELVRLQESAMEIERRLLELDEEHLTMELALGGGNPLRSSALMPGSPEETELRRLAVELAQRQRVLSPDNPELKRLEDRISAIAELVPSAASEMVAVVGLGEPSAEQQSVLRRQMTLLEQQTGLLREQKTVIDERRESLEASIQETPQIELALNSLERRLGELQDQHSALVQRYVEARTGEQLETSQQSERFRVVEDALAPDHPVDLNRKKVVLFGSGGSVGLAFALALLLEMLRPALRTSAQMEQQLGIRPVISIPYVRTRWERRRRRLAWATALVLLALGSGLAIPYAIEKGNAVEMLAARFGMEDLFQAPRSGTGVARAAADADGLSADTTKSDESSDAMRSEVEVAAVEPEPLPIRSDGGEEAEAFFREAVDQALQEPERARILYTRAAALGHARAAYYLGQIYETGDGTAADLTLARAWYELASTENEGAREWLAELPGDTADEQPAAPIPLLAERYEDGDVDLVWTRADAQETFLIEFTDAPDAAPKFRGEVAGPTLSVKLPSEVDYWRIIPLGGEAGAAPWRKLGS